MKNIWFAIFWIMVGVGISFVFGGFNNQKNTSDQIDNPSVGSVKGVSNQPTNNSNSANLSPKISTKINIGDDAILGDKNKAKLAVVEFSDYECPFCKRFHNETFDQIVKDYVDTDQAIMVYKDFPLDFHNPAATIDANAAECVKDLAGDKKYFEMMKLIYQNTGSNGIGIIDEKIKELAGNLGINQDKFTKCFKDGTFKDEINNDLEEGKSIGVDGTPGFVIGILKSNGEVEGELVSGAQPFSEFKRIIDLYLSKL